MAGLRVLSRSRLRRPAIALLASASIAIAHGMLASATRAQSPDAAALRAMAQNLALPESAGAQKKPLVAKGLDAGQLEQICARMAAQHASARHVESIGHSLGLGDEALAQLMACATPAAASTFPQSPSGQSAESVEPPTPAPASGQALSNTERTFQLLDSIKAVPQRPATGDLMQYGYSLFAGSVSTYAPISSVPVGDDYIVGPGDELNVLLWGRLDSTLKLSVQRDGSVLVPEGVGPLQVSGLTFGQTKHLLEKRLSLNAGVQADVTMGQLRTIQVFVVGEVQKPGAYTVSALAHISNALSAAGGVSKVGSLRRIELRRGTRLARTLDLYQMLMHGIASNDERLEANDVVFVPVIGPVAGIAGDVKRPGIYELTNNREGIRSVLALAGGVTAFAYSRRLQIVRAENHVNMVVLDVDFAELPDNPPEVRDGDLVEVFPILPGRLNSVKLDGNVRRPGVYEWHRGMRVSDLIKAGEGVDDGTFFKYALVRRIQESTRLVHLLPVELGLALSQRSSSYDIELQPRDELAVFRDSEMGDPAAVQVIGEVRKPGTYPLNPGMKVSDLIYMAGGLKEDAYTAQAELAQTMVRAGSQTTHTYIDFDLGAALNGSSSQDFALSRDDQVFVRRAPNWHMPLVVNVDGEVLRPGPYTIRPDDQFISLLQRCGGLLSDAYLPGIVLTRTSVKEIEEQRIKESTQRLQQEILRLQLLPHEAGQNENKTDIGVLQQLVAQGQSLTALGRVVLHFHNMKQITDQSTSFRLETDDRILVPKRPGTVLVMGQVFNPTAMIFEPNLTVRDYLDRAGSFTPTAAPENVMLIRADGTVVTDQELKDSESANVFPLLPIVSRLNLNNTSIEPGDTIYVPEKLTYVSSFQLWKDITTISANAALTIATMGLLASNL